VAIYFLIVFFVLEMALFLDDLFLGMEILEVVKVL
jgi:hypothetical protein